MGRDCASKRVPIALAEADQRTSGRGHQRRLTSPPLPSRGARRSPEIGKTQRRSRADRRPSQPSQPARRDVRQKPAPSTRRACRRRPAPGPGRPPAPIPRRSAPEHAPGRKWPPERPLSRPATPQVVRSPHVRKARSGKWPAPAPGRPRRDRLGHPTQEVEKAALDEPVGPPSAHPAIVNALAA
jgi:hypothetical protein